MKYQYCSAAELIHDTRDLPYIYKGDAKTFPAVKGDFCPVCGPLKPYRRLGVIGTHDPKHNEPSCG